MSIAALLPRQVTDCSAEDAALAAAMKRADMGAVAAISVDDFDRVQATLGSRAAHRRMEALAEAMRNACRLGDYMARCGPSGFVVVAGRVRTLKATQGLAAQLMQAVARFEVDGEVHSAQVSVGICFFPSDASGPEEALRMARISALQARSSGKQVCFYTPSIDEEQAESVVLRRELVLSLNTQSFQVVYQPKFALHSPVLNGAEALVRWASPSQGPVSPDRFVPLVEQLGRIEDLTAVVLRKVAAQVAQWHRSAPPGFRVSVNLSGGELRPGRGTELLAILAAAGAPAERLEFEITESVLMQGRADALVVLETLKAAGASLAIDDFGTGYSSLGYLVSLPVDTVKIDRCFLRDLHRPNVQALLKSVVGMVHALDLRTTVEGVETIEQLEFVRALGADSVQGFFTGRPGTAEELTDNLRTAVAVTASPLPVAPARTEVDLAASSLPLLATVLHQLCVLAGTSPEPEVLVELARADPCLGLFVLQQSRSGGRARAELPSLSQSVMQVGAKRIVQSMLAGSTRRVFLPGSGATRLWTHSIEAACWSAAIASTCAPHVKSDRAYFAGLLHDIGRFVLLDTRAVETLGIEKEDWASPMELLNAERRTLDADHAVIGALEARTRGLSDDIVAVIELHHQPVRLLPAAFRDLVAVVQAADVMAVLQERQPELSRAGGIARAGAISRAIAPLRLPWIVDCDVLAALWGDVRDQSARLKAGIGL